MPTHFFKVVYRDMRGILRSPVASGQAGVVYAPGLWVDAPYWLQDRGYHLTVWETLWDAYGTMPRTRHHELWLCRVSGIIAQKPPCLANAALVPHSFDACPLYCQWPAGVVMAEWVMLKQYICNGEEGLPPDVVDRVVVPQDRVAPGVSVPKRKHRRIQRFVQVVRSGR